MGGTPKWLAYVMENPTKWMIWRYPYFRKPPMWGGGKTEAIDGPRLVDSLRPFIYLPNLIHCVQSKLYSIPFTSGG